MKEFATTCGTELRRSVRSLLLANYKTYLPNSLVFTESAIAVWARLYNTYNVGADRRWVMPGEYGYQPLLDSADPRYPYQKYGSGSVPMVNYA